MSGTVGAGQLSTRTYCELIQPVLQDPVYGPGSLRGVSTPQSALPVG